MTKRLVLFSDALRETAGILSRVFPRTKNPLIIRDINGRIHIGIDTEGKHIAQYEKKLENEWDRLGPYGQYQGRRILSRGDFFDPDSVFASGDILEYRVPNTELTIKILDRQIVGQDWTRSVTLHAEEDARVPRLVFYGFKGGVGRSTAIAILAYYLARKGKNVLLIDFDLESPGLSGLMLPPERSAEFGIVDWFVEDVFGQGKDVLPGMISLCPLSQAEGVSGRIDVAAASGMAEPAYLAKLSRVYADVPAPGGRIERFPDRMIRLVKALEEQVAPDVVLIDSRAGLHDLAAVSVVRLATKAFLFAVDSPQTWQGYRLLFTHWQFHPQIAREVREHLAVVDTLFPEVNQEERARSFLEHAYDLFSSTLYDEIPPGADEMASGAFNFDPNDRMAPHYPLRVKWNARFQEFSTSLLSDGIITWADIDSAYGDFLSGVELLIEGEQI